MSKEDSILIIGGGTWGCGIALELARNEYSNVTVLDGEDVPSSIAAGNDLNKIMEEGLQSEDDTDSAYAWNRLHDLCAKAWLHDPVYKPFYHRTGYVMAASSDAAYQALLKDIKGHEDDYKEVTSAEQFRNTMPKGALTGDFVGWRGFAKESGAGWVFAKGAIIAAKQEAESLGARFVTGTRGRVDKLLFSGVPCPKGKGSLQGVRTADGTIHQADTTILANGANADSLVDLKHQLRPTAWTLAHIRMTPQEAELYRNLPVLFNIEKGFFMEPSADTHEMKICDEHPGYINPVYDDVFAGSEGKGIIVGSQPFAKQQIPLESEERMRAFLNDTMPHLSDRPLSFARICWDADTVDRMPLIDWYIPGGQVSLDQSESHQHSKRGRLLLAVGGSGHCFKTMPAMGQVVLEFLEERVDERTRRAFHWRPETAQNRNWWDVQDRWGAHEKVMDFNEVRGWTRIGDVRQQT